MIFFLNPTEMINNLKKKKNNNNNNLKEMQWNNFGPNAPTGYLCAKTTVS